MLISRFGCIYCGYVGECPCFQEVHAEVFKNNGHNVCTLLTHGSEKNTYICVHVCIKKKNKRQIW